MVVVVVVVVVVDVDVGVIVVAGLLVLAVVELELLVVLAHLVVLSVVLAGLYLSGRHSSSSFHSRVPALEPQRQRAWSTCVSTCALDSLA